MARLLCLACGGEADTLTAGPLDACPNCGDKGVPADLEDVTSITLTTHELRILTIWASNWANAIASQHPNTPRVLQTILDRIGMQTSAALTLRQEIADIRAAYPDSKVTVYNDRGEEVDL